MAGAALSGTGIWSAELRYHRDAAEVVEAAAELESLGYTALWVPDVGGDLLAALERLLGATSSLTVASGVLNIWRHDASAVAAWWAALSGEHRARTMLGLGVSHGPVIGEEWRRPLAVMGDYLDGLDAGGVPSERRCLAALGPRMLAMARDRSAGAHPYLVTPEHTALTRAALGDALLAVEQGVVLEADAVRARAIARDNLELYCSLPNYVNNWLRLGFTQDDVDRRSDALVDALIAWGDVDAIASRIRAHRAAGADHVCIQVLNERGAPMNRAAWRALSPSGGA